MNYLNRIWTRVARFAEALEGVDDPTGHYMFLLKKRIDKLERDLERLEGQLGSHAGDGIRH